MITRVQVLSIAVAPLLGIGITGVILNPDYVGPAGALLAAGLFAIAIALCPTKAG